MTHPQDKQLLQDIFTIGAILALSMFIYSVLHMNGGMSPADECANNVSYSLSPYQVHRLTGAQFPVIPREVVVSWCADNILTYEREIQSARQFPEFPHHLDMLID